MSECLLCRGDGPFDTDEHIVPESLGNDEDILSGVVCNGCQSYFAHSVEQPALTHTPFAYWRTLLGIPTKKGRLPSARLGDPPRGRLPSHHPSSDPIVVTAMEDGTTRIDDLSGRLHDRFARGERRTNLVLTPWHLSIMGRFLGKMGLEYLFVADAARAMTAEFDALRSFVRHGSTRELWPIFSTSRGTVDQLSTLIRDDANGPEFEVLCYKYNLSETRRGDHVFAFSIGTDVYMVCLSHRRPEEYLNGVLIGQDMACLWYKDGSW